MSAITREEALQEASHGKMMIDDPDYFNEWTVESYLFKEPVFLCDIISELREHCGQWNQSFEELLEYMEGV